MKQEFVNNLNFSYQNYNQAKEVFFTISGGGSKTQNKIVNSIDTASNQLLNGANNQVQVIKPVNRNGVYSAYYDMSVNLPLHIFKGGSNVNLSNAVNVFRDVTDIYHVKNNTTSIGNTQMANANLEVSDKLNIGLEATVTYNTVKNSVNAVPGFTSWYHSYIVNLNYAVISNLQFATTFDYLLNKGLAGGYNNAVPLWNMSLAWQCLKNKRGEIKMEGFDLLNQNQSFNRTVYENNIVDTRQNMLTRYLILKFTFGINGMVKK